jgi:hypothetical protein
LACARGVMYQPSSEIKSLDLVTFVSEYRGSVTAVNAYQGNR